MMKAWNLSLFFLATYTVVEGFHPNDDIYFHQKSALGPSMWHFSSDGLVIFSPEGNILKAPPKAETCETYTSVDSRTNETEVVNDCRYFALSSDGHRYVWAAGRSSSERVEAFDIDTGDRVGYTETCRVPMDLGYHPGRREMFVQCHTAEIDVFSVHALGLTHDKISVGEGNPAGRVLIHSSLGSYGYSAHNAFNGIVEFDLASREMKAQYEFPLADSARDMAYSPFNRHIYVRPRHCCTCGYDGADAASCGGRWGPVTAEPVNITTGPSAGLQVDGVCGTSCEGSLADTVGVYEFDTVRKEVIGSINIDPEDGFGARPVASPDGRYILLLGADGGKFVTVLTLMQNGQASRVAAKIPVNFEGPERAVVVSDFAFMTNNGRNVLVLAASTDNHIVLVDMDDNYSTSRLTLTIDASKSTEGSTRYLEWAVGTDYVWVTGGAAEELYVVQVPSGASIKEAKVVKTIGGISEGELIFADNFERKASVQAVTADGQAFMGPPSVEISKQADETALLNEGDSDDEDFSIAVAAFFIGVLSLVLNIVLVVKVFFADNSSGSIVSHKDITTKPDDDNFETNSLGSKSYI